MMKNCKNKGKYAFLLGTLGTPPRGIANTGFMMRKTEKLLGTLQGTAGTQPRIQTAHVED